MALRRVFFVGVALAAVVAACSLPSSDEFVAKATADAGRASTTDSGLPLPTREAGTPEAGSVDTGPADASTDADAGVVDLLKPVDSTFDNGKCGQDTGGYQADLTASTTARSGPDACQICRSHPNGDNAYSLDTQIHIMPLAGQQFMATAYVRATPDATDQQAVTLTLRTHNGDFAAVQEVVSSPPTQLTDEYQLISVVLDVTDDTSNMDYFVGGSPPLSDASPCFLVDDVTIWQSN